MYGNRDGKPTAARRAFAAFGLLALASCRTMELEADVHGLDELPPHVPAAERPPVDELLEVEAGPYLVGPADELTVVVQGHPEMGSQVSDGDDRERKITRVDADGTIDLPLVGRVAAAGSTEAELTERLRELHAGLTANPRIAVHVVEHLSQRVLVDGEVERPGPVFLSPVRRTLGEVVAAAGGPSDTADQRRASLFRAGRVHALDWWSAARDGGETLDLPLLAGDRVHFPRADERFVYVQGEVKNQGVIPLPSKGLSLLEVLGLAGGPHPWWADPELVYVVREDPATGAPVVCAITVEELMLRPDVPAAPGDRIFVAPTTLTVWERTVRQVLPVFGIGSAVGAAVN